MAKAEAQGTAADADIAADTDPALPVAQHRPTLIEEAEARVASFEAKIAKLHDDLAAHDAALKDAQAEVDALRADPATLAAHDAALAQGT